MKGAIAVSDNEVIEIKDTYSIADNGCISIDDIREAAKLMEKQCMTPDKLINIPYFIVNLSKQTRR